MKKSDPKKTPKLINRRYRKDISFLSDAEKASLLSYEELNTIVEKNIDKAERKIKGAFNKRKRKYYIKEGKNNGKNGYWLTFYTYDNIRIRRHRKQKDNLSSELEYLIDEDFRNERRYIDEFNKRKALFDKITAYNTGLRETEIRARRLNVSYFAEMDLKRIDDIKEALKILPEGESLYSAVILLINSLNKRPKRGRNRRKNNQ